MDTIGVLAAGASLALDVHGRTHICYSRSLVLYPEVDFDLFYAYRDDNDWQIVMVEAPEVISDPAAIFAQSGQTSLVLDANDSAHIGDVVDYNWDFGYPSDLKYAAQDDTGWTIELVDKFGSYPGGPGSFSMTLDKKGSPHVSTNESSQETSPEIIHLKYRYQDADDWYVQTVDGGGGEVGYFASLASDSRGYPHISYYKQDNQDLRYVYRGKEGRHIQVVENEGDVGKWTSFALDDNQNPHMSYIKNVTCSYKDWIYVCVAYLKYAFHNSTGWQTQTLDRTYTYDGSVRMDTSLALDAEGYPHISYIGEAGELMVANMDASSWVTQTVVIGESFIEGPSLALDNGG